MVVSADKPLAQALKSCGAKRAPECLMGFGLVRRKAHLPHQGCSHWEEMPVPGRPGAWAWAWASVEVLSTSSSSKVSESQKFSPYFTKDEVEAKEAGHSLGNLFVFFGFYENKLRTSWVG